MTAAGLMCSREADDLIAKNESVALKYLMCSREVRSIEAKDAVALKYLMCSREAEDQIAKGQPIAF